MTCTLGFLRLGMGRNEGIPLCLGVGAFTDDRYGMEADTAPELSRESLSRDGGSIHERATARTFLSSLVAKAAGAVRLPRLAGRGAGAGASSSEPGDGRGARPALGPQVRALVARVPRTPFAAAVVIVAVAIAFVAVVSYYSAREFSGRAADTRASNEAMSFAAHSSRLANGDAFAGYIQILRYAEDPVVTAKYADPTARQNALQQLLYLNTNKFNSLTIADRTGIIFATTDSRITSLKDSATFAETRANLSPANSDIVLPVAGQHGYIEYTAPLHDVDGSIWGILVGRADPADLWHETLIAAVDGGQNVIINSEGQYAAGVPDELLRLPWHGQPLPNGAVRATIAGVDSICGLAPIGKDTQIDRGLNVASCLPASITQAEQNDATGKQSLITLAAAVLALVAAAGGLRIAWWRGGLQAQAGAGGRGLEMPERLAALEAAPVATADVAADVAAVADAEADEPVAATAGPEPMMVVQLPPPDIDAVTLIDAYEARNARLADRLREQLQARLLIAATQADEAYKLAGADDGLAASLHEKAMTELEALREREIRAIGQELYPGLVRLGLPGALRAMKKELLDVIEVRLHVDATADAVSASGARATLAPGLRLVLYRFVLDATQALAFAGASSAEVALGPEGEWLVAHVGGRPADGETIDPDGFAANAIALEAYAGGLDLSEHAAGVTMTARVPAPPRPVAEDLPNTTVVDDIDDDAAGDGADDAAGDDGGSVESEALAIDASAFTGGDAATDADEDDADGDSSLIDAFTAKDAGAASPVRAFTLDGEGDELTGAFAGPSRGIAAELELVQTELFGSVIVALDIADGVLAADERGEISAQARGLVREVVKGTLLALKAVDADRATVSALLDGRMLVVSVASDGGEAPALLGEVERLQDAIRAADGMLLIAADGVAAEVTVRVPSDALGDS